MPTTIDFDKTYLTFLSRIIEEQLGDRVNRFLALQFSPQGVTGTFLSEARRFNFSITPTEIRYGLATEKLDSYELAKATAELGLSHLPLGTDAYSAAYIEAYQRCDSKKKCAIGFGCGGSCISKKKECRLLVKSPETQQMIRKLGEVQEYVQRKPGNVILGLLGAAAIGMGIYTTTAYFQGKPGKGEYKPTTPPYRGKTPESKPSLTPRTPRQRPASTLPIVVVPPKSPPTPPQVQRRTRKRPSVIPEGQMPIDMNTRYVETVKEVKTVPEDVSGIKELPIDHIKVAPRLFQYKMPEGVGKQAQSEFKEKGVTGALSDAKVWNPALAGNLLTWRVPKGGITDPDGNHFKEGETLLVHGHHRLALAQRAEGVFEGDAATGKVRPGKPDKVRVEYIDVPTPKEARVVGALQNIAQGAGTSKDAANVFRELNVNDPAQLKQWGISLKGKVADEGLGLAGLTDTLWRKVSDPSYQKASGERKITTTRASEIGKIRNPDLQNEVWDVVRTSDDVDDDFVRALSDRVQRRYERGEIAFESPDTGNQLSLFDQAKVAVAGERERAEADSHIERQITDNDKFWSGKRMGTIADRLKSENVGDLDLDRAGEVSEQTAKVRWLYRKAKALPNDPNAQAVESALNKFGSEIKAARSQGADKAEIKKIKEAQWEQMQKLLTELLGS